MCRGIKFSSRQYLVVIQDVSALRQALERTRSSEEKIRIEYEQLREMSKQLRRTKSRYENLYESSPDLLRTIDTDERIVECNRTYAESLGYSKDEVLGRSIFEHTAEKSHDAMRDSIAEWKRADKIVNREIWMKRKNGTTFPALLSGTSLYDEDGNIIGRTVSLRDITNIHEATKSLLEKDVELEQRYLELKEAYALLAKIEEKYRGLYDSSPLPYRTIDKNGIIHDCNKSYCISLGFSKEEIIGSSIFDHVSERSRDELARTFHRWKTEGKTGEVLVWLKRKDGSELPSMLQATSLYNKNGELIGSNTVIRDISETYSARQQLEEEKIKRLSALGEMAARIAHDMRNPMSVIKNAINLVRMQNPSFDENITNKFVLIDSAITRMTHQIDEVLDFVSPKQPHLVHTDTDQVLQDAVNRIIKPSTVQINLPAKKVEITCDPYKMEIALVNLISNAIQAMENKGTITIETSEDSSSVILSVTDMGPGIPPHLLPKIFDPLFTTRQIGTGLGLTSCKSIVEQHGGTIEVSTQVGKGTTFTIKIPKR